jgi:hypothetical protein
MHLVRGAKPATAGAAPSSPSTSNTASTGGMLPIHRLTLLHFFAARGGHTNFCHTCFSPLQIIVFWHLHLQHRF